MCMLVFILLAMEEQNFPLEHLYIFILEKQNFACLRRDSNLGKTLHIMVVLLFTHRCHIGEIPLSMAWRKKTIN